MHRLSKACEAAIRTHIAVPRCARHCVLCTKLHCECGLQACLAHSELHSSTMSKGQVPSSTAMNNCTRCGHPVYYTQYYRGMNTAHVTQLGLHKFHCNVASRPMLACFQFDGLRPPCSHRPSPAEVASISSRADCCPPDHEPCDARCMCLRTSQASCMRSVAFLARQSRHFCPHAAPGIHAFRCQDPLYTI